MASRQQIIQENIAFAYGRSKETEAHDLDKRAFVKSAPKFTDPTEIKLFEGEFHFLSPSFPCRVCLRDNYESYPSFEHALIASKLSKEMQCDEARNQIRLCSDILEAKRIVSRFLTSFPHCEVTSWKGDSLKIAESLLRDKFMRNKPLRSQLVATKRRTLSYYNSHNDNYWGMSLNKAADGQPVGQNLLGKLLDKIRGEISSGDDLLHWFEDRFNLVAPEKVLISLSVQKERSLSDTGARNDADAETKVFERLPYLLLGKCEDNEIVALHQSVSRTHLAIVADSVQGLFAIDLQSANGSNVDGQTLAGFVPHPLISGASVVTVGASTKRYIFSIDATFDSKRKQQEMLISKMTDPAVIKELHAAHMEEHTVFIGNIPFTSNEADLQSFLASCGPIVKCHMPMDKEKLDNNSNSNYGPTPCSSGVNTSLQHRGIAFVTFANTAGLLQALSLDGDLLEGRKLKIKKTENSSQSKPPNNNNNFTASSSSSSHHHNAGDGRDTDRRRNEDSRADSNQRERRNRDTSARGNDRRDRRRSESSERDDVRQRNTAPARREGERNENRTARSQRERSSSESSSRDRKSRRRHRSSKRSSSSDSSRKRGRSTGSHRYRDHREEESSSDDSDRRSSRKNRRKRSRSSESRDYSDRKYRTSTGSRRRDRSGNREK